MVFVVIKNTRFTFTPKKGVFMYKLLAGIMVFAALSYGDIITTTTIDLKFNYESWSHDSAALVRINLDSYLGDNKVVESAYLQFTGVQNTMEPETNDILNISLLKLNSTGIGQQNCKYYFDDQNPSNYFKKTTGTFSWVEGKSNVDAYVDNNGLGAIVDVKPSTVAYWEGTTEGKAAIAAALKEGCYWHYDYMNSNYTHHWTKYKMTPEDFTRDLNVAAVNEFKDAKGGWIGIGIDADCHYVGKVSLVVTTRTASVPEPTVISLLGCGILGLFFARRKKQ